eukprot:TRINITY_DN8955_c0_g1_i1.p1 TRINITY_DN8955_c0_g1~~TRINITY_DN8955_c0_g1_i1.p1  ORF type:complete len:194 (+),score=48.80 TRINITY_DN8955_c0_g1_i1:119-700(+)
MSKETKSEEFARVIVVGVGGVGKTSWTNRLVHGMLVENYDPNIEDSYVKTMDVDGVSASVEILDSAGEQYEFVELFDRWIRQSEGFIFMYSVTSKSSKERLNDLHSKVLHVKDAHRVPQVLAGNKCDLSNERVVLPSDGEELAASWGCKYFEMSAKDDVNCAEVFAECVREIRSFRLKAKSSEYPHKRTCAIC